MKKFTVITLSAMFCGLVVLSACGGGAASGSAASSDAPLGRVPAIFAEVAAKKKALDESLRKEDDLDRYQKKLKEFDEYRWKRRRRKKARNLSDVKLSVREMSTLIFR